MADFRSIVPFGFRSGLRSGFEPFAQLQDEMNRLFDSFEQNVPVPSLRLQDSFALPKMDVMETDAGIELTAELPGFEEKDVSLEIHDGVLTIKAQHEGEREEKDEKKHYHLIERTSGSFMRRFALPFEADADKASAHLKNGLLKVLVPRAGGLENKPKAIPLGKPPADKG